MARTYAGMEQTDLADMTGLSRRTIGNYERGAVTPRRAGLIAVSLATGVDLGWLETGETPAGDDPDGGKRLPLLDSNQQPFGYTDGDTSPIPWPAVARLPCVA